MTKPQKPPKHSTPRTASTTKPAAPATSLEELAAQAGADAPAKDTPATVAPGDAGGAAPTIIPVDTALAKSEREAGLAPALYQPTAPFVTLSFPLPADIPAAALKDATLVVHAKHARGRRRAGHTFTREDTSLPYSELAPEQLTLLQGDDELVLALRIPQPA